jgi:hypothetical protein
VLINESRRKAYRPLSESGVPRPAQERLAALGITTLQELRDVWSYGNRQLLMDYLGESPVRFTAVRPAKGLATAKAGGPGGLVNVLAAGNPPPLVKHARGLYLTPEHRRRAAQEPARVRLAQARGGAKPKVFLGDRFPAVRDQGHRGTCAAFASVAYLEYHLAHASRRTQHRSEQFVFWACKQVDGKPREDATHLTIAREVLKDRGACLARTWPYNPLPGATVDQGPPPDKAGAEAAAHTWSDARDLALGSMAALQACLDQGKPVVLGVQTFPNWDYPSVSETGEITMPLPRMQPDGGHAICVVGYEERGGVPGGGAFIFRNSWGRKWARPHGRFGPGYGTLFFDYVSRYGVEAYS